MAQPDTKPVTNVAPIKATRTKSTETILKEKLRLLTRNLEGLDKKVTEFEALEKEMDNVDATRIKVKGELDKVKAELIKELGLG